VVVVGECLLVVGGEGTAHEGLFSSERCPLPTARCCSSSCGIEVVAPNRKTVELVVIPVCTWLLKSTYFFEVSRVRSFEPIVPHSWAPNLL